MKITAGAFAVDWTENRMSDGLLPRAGEIDGDLVSVPGGAWPLAAEFIRQGPDLLVAGKLGESFVVRDFFAVASQPDLVTDGGAILRADLVNRLAAAPAPGQVAQVAPADSAEAVGRVEAVIGDVTALRADGTQSALVAGDSVFAGDVLQTGAGASIGVLFADQTTMSLGAEARMVIDEFVYDSDARVGAMDVNVVQGVFTFVSGEIAKLGPDMMTVYTPVATVGIRGTKVAGRAAAEGEQNTISLLPNDDGTVGVIAVGNQSGSLPQILTVAGATTTIQSQFQPPAPPVVISPAQIEQQYGAALQTLTATRQAVQSRPDSGQDAPASQDGDQGAPGNTDGQDGGASDADGQSGDGQADENAGGPSDEELAARAAAEEAAAEGATPEEALDAAVEAAAEEALARGATPEEVAAAEAAARAAFNEALANGESPEAALNAALAATGEAEFTEIAVVGPGEGGEQDGDSLARDAADAALSEGAEAAEAFEAAARAAAEAAIAEGEDPREVEQAVELAREAYNDAIESGLSPEEALQIALAEAERSSDVFVDVSTINLGGDSGIFGFQDPLAFGTFDFARVGFPTFNYVPPEIITDFALPNVELVDLTPPGGFVSDFVEPPEIIEIISEDVVAPVEVPERFVATSGNDTFSGSSGNTEFVYSQSRDGGTIVPIDGGGAFAGGSFDTITDAGGTDRLTFEDLDGVGIRMSDLDPGNVKFEIFLTNTDATASALSGSALTTVHITRSIEQLSGAGTSLANPGDGIVVNDALDVTGSETAYILAGTWASDTLTLDDPNAVGAIVFGKGGADTINVGSANNTAPDNSVGYFVFGGAGNDTIDYSNIDGAVIAEFSSSKIEVFHGAGGGFVRGVESVVAGAQDDVFRFEAGSAVLTSIDGGAGSDSFVFESGVQVSGTLDGGGADDDFIFTGLPGAAATIGDFLSGTDRLVFDLNSFFGHDGSGGLSTDSFVIGSTALDSNDFFVFDGTSLFYDEDGNGAGSPLHIAILGTTITSTDIRFLDFREIAGTTTQTLTANVDDLIFGSDGSDTITLSDNAELGDVVVGDGGNDTLVLAAAGSNTIEVSEVHTITGGAGDDEVTLLTAMGFEPVDSDSTNFTFVPTVIDLGDEVEVGDTLNLAAGLNIGSVLGAELINGTNFADELHLNNDLNGTNIDLRDGIDTVSLGDNGNVLTIANVENVTGGAGNDTITVSGTTGASIAGGAGSDSLIGGAGNDTLIAGNSTALELIANGDFETGDFTGWTVDDLAGGSGSFFIDSDTQTPLSSLATVGAAGGTFYAVSDQPGPGTHALSQLFTVGAGAESVILTFDMFVNDQSSAGPTGEQAGLDHTVVPNQHARVDILASGADPFDTTSGVLGNFFLGIDIGQNPNPYTSYSFDITSVVSGGGDFVLRFAEVDNQGFFNQGVDNVSLQVLDLNTLDGGAGNDTLVGGNAKDVLIGGAGTDLIDLTNSTGPDIVRYEVVGDGGDTVSGFNTGTGVDLFQFLRSAFNGDSNSDGLLDDGTFVKAQGATAGDANDFFLFDTETNTLSYDADGNGQGAAETIATLDQTADMNATDITFV